MTLTPSVRAGLLAACLAAPGAALAAVPNAADTMMDVASADFVILVASSNTFEIQSSELATKKATSEDVKAFAGQMIEDHMKAAKELQDALGEAPLPADPLSPRHAGMIALRETAEDADFERLYVGMQAGAHIEAVALFRTFSKSGDNDQGTSFAKATLPTPEEHEAHIPGDCRHVLRKAAGCMTPALHWTSVIQFTNRETKGRRHAARARSSLIGPDELSL